MKKLLDKYDADKVIDAMGGTGDVATLCGVTDSCVSQWRKRNMPQIVQRYLMKVRPKAFKDEYKL